MTARHGRQQQRASHRPAHTTALPTLPGGEAAPWEHRRERGGHPAIIRPQPTNCGSKLEHATQPPGNTQSATHYTIFAPPAAHTQRLQAQLQDEVGCTKTECRHSKVQCRPERSQEATLAHAIKCRHATPAAARAYSAQPRPAAAVSAPPTYLAMLRSRSPTAGSLLLSMLSLNASMRATKVGSCTGKPCSS